jgi:hypothetical protein
MSEDRGGSGGSGPGQAVPSAADRMYPHLGNGESGELGETGYDTARRIQQDGIAKPAASPFAEERPPRTERNGPSFDSARYQAPQGYEVNGPLMAEFSQLANEFGLNQQQGSRALDFYRHSLEAGEEHYAKQLAANTERLSRELPAEDVQMVKELIADEELTPPTMKNWILRFGSHPDVAQMLTRWARAIRSGRY